MGKYGPAFHVGQKVYVKAWMSPRYRQPCVVTTIKPFAANRPGYIEIFDYIVTFMDGYTQLQVEVNLSGTRPPERSDDT